MKANFSPEAIPYLLELLISCFQCHGTILPCHFSFPGAFSESPFLAGPMGVEEEARALEFTFQQMLVM